MTEVWTKIKKSLIDVLPAIAESLNKPATQNEIELLEKTIGKSLPLSFIEYLKVCNGQNHDDFNITFVGANSLLTISEIIEVWKTQIFLFADEPKIAINENKVQPKIWDNCWIPFTDFMGQQRLVIDLNPGKNGVYGQVLQLWAGQDLEDDGVVVANSFEEFSQHILRDLLSKKYEISADSTIELNDEWII